MHSYTKNKKISGEVNWVPLALSYTTAQYVERSFLEYL